MLVLLFIATSLGCANIHWTPFYHKHLAALILARGGSKGIPLKNLALIGNTTLLKRSASTAIASKIFDSIWISTDNVLIYREASRIKVNVHWRAPETATDTAKSLDAVREFLEKHPQVDVVGLIQCTSPFLKTVYLHEAVAKLQLGVYECVFSVTRSHKLLWRKINDRFLPTFDIAHRPRRQDYIDEYIENGMFYFVSRSLVEKGRLQSDRYAALRKVTYVQNFEAHLPQIH